MNARMAVAVQGAAAPRMPRCSFTQKSVAVLIYYDTWASTIYGKVTLIFTRKPAVLYPPPAAYTYISLHTFVFYTLAQWCLPECESPLFQSLE